MKDDLKKLLGIDDTVLNAVSGDWHVRITNEPCRNGGNERVHYDLEFVRQDKPSIVRVLHLVTRVLDVDQDAQKVVAWITEFWLNDDEREGTHKCYPEPLPVAHGDLATVIVDGTRVPVRLV
jgi:hypothetical protein